MKAKLGAITRNYYGQPVSAKLDVSAYSIKHFLDKFQPLYEELGKNFRTTGHSCSNDQQQIGLLLPEKTLTTVKKGYHIRDAFSPEGEDYLKSLLEFLDAYGFSELMAFPSAGVFTVHQSQSNFNIWLLENYEHSGEEYFLLKNPSDYNLYELRKLRKEYQSSI